MTVVSLSFSIEEIVSRRFCRSFGEQFFLGLGRLLIRKAASGGSQGFGSAYPWCGASMPRDNRAGRRLKEVTLWWIS